ncbi:hypothetical protein Poli38472_000511 [Pythium oligandrum]|uniref:MtN3-like protein n=1 Tax=Pythium oligandrum TaxID=41045 RepID=A0A8K1CCF7_PYTOL|nr:hypothetical protein Poli38472_000511 [Pythium oligandrum]|eukprot:TMW60469.1 hypothetical protein Poli38472_000511 [Pythium oligandrum]
MSVFVDVLRVLTACSTVLMILSPTPDVYRIYKTRDCGHASIIPLVSLLANSHMWMLYGYLERNYFPVFATYLTGNIAALVYMTVYYRSTADRVYVRKAIAVSVGFSLLVSIYVLLAFFEVTNQTREQLTDTVGYLGITVSLVLFASPFEKVVQVFRYRSAVFLPINLVVASTISNGIWVVYSLVDYDLFIFVPNAVVFVFGLVQMALYFVFHPKTHPLIRASDDELDSKASVMEDDFLDHNYFPLFSTFVLGDVFAIIYITIYYRATTERQYVGRLIGFVVGFLTLVTIYVVLAIYGVTHQTRKQLLQVVGYIGIAVSVVLFASPFEKALQVIRHRLAVFLSINLIVASTVNKGIWVVYTLVDLDWFLFAPNMLIFAFGLVQTALYFIFHPKTHPLILPQDEEVANKLERAESSPQSIKRSHSVEYICMLESPTVCIEPIHTI